MIFGHWSIPTKKSWRLRSHSMWDAIQIWGYLLSHPNASSHPSSPFPQSWPVFISRAAMWVSRPLDTLENNWHNWYEGSSHNSPDCFLNISQPWLWHIIRTEICFPTQPPFPHPARQSLSPHSLPNMRLHQKLEPCLVRRVSWDQR